MFCLDDNKYKNECGKCCSKCMDRQTHLCKKSCFYLTFRCDDCRHQENNRRLIRYEHRILYNYDW